MKNKNIKNILIILFYLFFLNNALAENQFIFESNIIEYKDNENLVIAKGKVKITSSDQIVIFADESEYFKITNKLYLNGNVVIVDEERNIIIKSNKVSYDKIEELIRSDDKTELKIGTDYVINTSDITYFRTCNIEHMSCLPECSYIEFRHVFTIVFMLQGI